MSRTRRVFGSSWGSSQLRVERLERRRVFSASTDLSTLSVIAELTNPAPGAAMVHSPTEIDLTFNQPFDPTTVGLDVDLQQIGPDGSVIADDGWMLSEPFDLTGSPTTLPITINGTLAPGEYRIVLTGSMSTLSGLSINGNPAAPLANSGVDEPVAVFTIVNPSQTLADATDLGTLGRTPTTAVGSLDLQNDPGDYQLYKITLAPGHFWLLGGEVAAAASSDFTPGLALFDASGKPLAFGELVGNGQGSYPHVFAGLGPGTYYLGVSNQLNDPEFAAGYDPVTGVPGTGLSAVPGGPFNYQVRVLANIADAPTTVLGTKLSWVDPLTTSPTGFSVVFSGAIDISSLANNGSSGSDPSSFPALQVVDQNGRVYGITLVNYLESNSQFDFAFNQPLPPGHYSLIDPAQGGLKDLVGRTPVAPGEPAGVLATWDVTRGQTPAIPGNLGVIWPSATADPAAQSFFLTPGSGTIYRFVVPADGFYKINSQCNGGSLEIEILGPDGLAVKYPGQSGGTYQDVANLKAGVYYIQYIATGTTPAWGTFFVNSQPSRPAIIFENGIGQGSALNLTLINPVAPTGPATPPAFSSTFPGPLPLPATPAGALPPLGIPAATDIEAPTSAPGLVLTLGNTLVGTPTPGAEHVAAVGPGVQTEYTALAAYTPGVLQGIKYGRTPSNVSNWDRGESPLDSPVEPAPDDAGEAVVEAPQPNQGPAPADGALVEQQGRAAPNQDERALLSLAGTNWFSRLGAAVRDWFGTTDSADVEPAFQPALEPKLERFTMARDDLARPASEPEAEHAHLAAPLGLSAVSVLVLRLRLPVRRWVGRRRGAPPQGASSRTAGRGPHTRR
jgi:hypothetical protein